ncbi:SpoIIE family protein phosphatase [Actinacidiphila sp. DG2A-62]|uniref:ATP-binding SpoIIE family protein phosphatase n=1 Tax=Actinacidiphila sp. DG2A-62 TaxID=3108821 RepID=UPI002DB927E0|nr:SpoIIE family protein phosphatase [Actinacidiphila sp. DG2A-62]MEC3993891.1 SpoIIE family protein phosphatase [Actinacidiphila sp. DG2A-62]
MDRTVSGQPPSDLVGPRTRAERVLADALLHVYEQVRPSTCTAYVPADGGRTLTAAMTVDTPLSFGVPSSFDADDLVWPTTRSYRSGEVVVFDAENMRESARLSTPAIAITVPFAMTVASVPVRTVRRRYGTIGLRWVPPRPVSARERAFLQAAADELAAELERLAGVDDGLVAPVVPVFLPARPARSTGDPDDERRLLREAAASSAIRSSYLHQLQRLAAELTGAVRAADILAIGQARVVQPFGGRAAALSMAEGGRLHVAGAVGLSREAVAAIEGTPLSRRTPETDAIHSAQVRVYASAADLARAYPGLEIDMDQQARAYIPLMYTGRAVGCCTLEFAGPYRPLTPTEISLLTLMLEQVGQSLARARSHEVEHALTRRIQHALLPGSFPHVPEAVATARYFSATEGVGIGGDWYDVLTLPEKRLGLVVGDVEGHSLDAATVMGQLRSGVRAYAAEGHDPAVVLERSNRLLCGLDTDLYATCCCVWIDLTTGATVVASAGHPAPLIGDGRSGVGQPSLSAGPPLGVQPQATYRDAAVEMTPGSVVALFTDGLLDVRRMGVDASVGRLAALLADHGGEDLEVLADTMVAGRRQDAPGDDATLVLVRYEGARPDESARVARMRVERHDLHAVLEARRFVRELLARWGLPGVCDDLEVLVSEVVTNALIHAHSDVDLRLRDYPDRVRVEVRDSDPYPPVPTALLDDDAGNLEAESGRGLLIVDALASAWGSSPAGRGKTTWFEVGVGGSGDGQADPDAGAGRDTGGDTRTGPGTRAGGGADRDAGGDTRTGPGTRTDAGADRDAGGSARAGGGAGAGPGVRAPA